VFGKKNKVFSVIFRATEVGKIHLAVKNSDAFLNDGKGTRSTLIGISETINVTKQDKEVNNQLSDLVLKDKDMPNEFKIELGRDSNISEGKYFISFYTTDDGSGINRYEVRENNLPAVRSGNIYVLEDQSLNSTIEVKAIDNAGNFRIKTLDLHKKESSKTSLLVLLIIIIFGTVLYFKFNKK
jgi:hypothetical protein